nr:EAL domain-containing protein [uncultured Halomonas sp.]
MCHLTKPLPDEGDERAGEARALGDSESVRPNASSKGRTPVSIAGKAKALIVPFEVNTKNSALLHAQMKAFSKQVPLLYFILSINALTLAWNFHGMAPLMLTVIFPIFLTGICVLRVVVWLRSSGRQMSDKEAIWRLYGVVVAGDIIGIIYLVWTFALYSYGDAYTKSLAVLFVTITTISMIFCLMHLRAAALTMMVTIAVPYSIFLIFTQDSVFSAVGVNLLLVSGAMVYIVFVVSTDFEKMINSQSETARLSDENYRLANVDNVTGLPNRRYFFHQLDRLLGCARHEKRAFVVGVIDLDGFKAINDIYGHAIGDRVLKDAGKRLKALSSETIVMARLGGDEFGVLLTDTSGTAEVMAFGERVCAALQVPFSMPGIQANVSGSAGFALYPEAGTTPEVLYERADYALNYAKGSQRGKPTVFSKSHETEIRTRSLIEQALRCADLDKELSLNFQPLFDIQRQRPVGFEALARWHHAELGSIPPDVFIAIAERTELINTLTQVLLRKALAAAATWPQDIYISFNLSVRDIISPNAISGIIKVIEESGVEPTRIGFEVTESALMGDFDQAHDSISRLRALGAKISLDDFGTGYSSLSYVHRLPLDTIKIDRSFVTDIETRDTSRDVIRTIVDLCRNLEIGCVVEGMETARQVAILRKLGCHTMQGYFFSKPLAQNEVVGFLTQRELALSD